MRENPFSLKVRLNDKTYGVLLSEGKPPHYYDPGHYDPTHHTKPDLKPEAIPEALSSFVNRNAEKLAECSAALVRYTDHMTAPLPSHPQLGKGVNTDLTLYPDNKGVFRAEVSFFDRQGRGASQATSFLAGGLFALNLAGPSVDAPTFSLSGGDLRSTLTFSSLDAVCLALNKLAKSQDERINIGSGAAIGR